MACNIIKSSLLFALGVCQLCTSIYAYNLSATAGVGLNFTDNHNTTFYRFRTDDVNYTGLLGLGINTEYTENSTIGLGARYFYNHINGDVDPNIPVETSYKNKIHNVLTTLETTYNIFGDQNSLSIFGARAGAGLNAYYIDLTANNVANLGMNVDPERSWSAAAAGFFGLFVNKKIDRNYDLMTSLDYFYLGYMKVNKESRSSTSNNLFSEAKYHNHNITLSFTLLV